MGEPVSETNLPAWWHPLLHLHHRWVEKHVVPAEKAAAELGIDFNASAIRKALGYQRWTYLRRLRGLAIFFAALALFAVVTRPATCRPGGLLTTDEARCPTYTEYVFGPNADPWVSITPTLGLLAFFWIISAWRGENIPRLYKPLYLLLALLTASADLIAVDGGRYTKATRLNAKAAELGLPLRTVARNAASDFGNRGVLRKELLSHAELVETAVMQAADGLVQDRAASARKLGTLAGLIAGSIAADRFTQMLPPAELPEEAVIEPDRLDGRRLAKACLWSAATVTAFALLLAGLGTPAELLVPLAVVAFVVTAYVLLGLWYGLGEATRLTRSLMSFFSAGPPL
ncbi:hypothetical protein ACFWGL_27815 [Streptomyces sp. NPDC060286]|uniref:hypothetical protein n=1 Tax=unclassified Streptomyces TaxID=2593676 RepID=UPI0035E17521